MDSVARRSEERLPGIFVTLAFLAAGVLLYARLYGMPGMYESDNLMGEDIYRDLFIEGNPWELWSLPGAAQYAELALYMALRWLTGDVHAAMALHGSLVACLFALSAAYAVAPLLDSPRSRAIVYALAPLLAVFYPYPYAGWMITSKLAHGQTLSAALFASGFFLRRMDRAPSPIWHWAAFAGIALMIASDSLFILWFCLPALAMIAWRVWTRRLPFVAGACWWGAMACAWLAGMAVDAWLRNFPKLSFVNPGFGRMIKHLRPILMDTGAALFSSPVTVCWFALGCAGLAWALRGTGRQREGAAFFLLCMAINLLGVALSGESEARYVFLWTIAPYSLGVLLFAGLLRERLSGVARRNVVKTGCPFLSLSLVVGLCLGAWHAWRDIRPPYYPRLARELDDLARDKGVRTGIAGYWDARLVNILSREGVKLIPVHEYGYTHLLFNGTRSVLRDRVDMLIANAGSPPYSRLNRDLEIRANAEPDEIVRLSDSVEALIYRQGAHHPTEVELLLNGERLVPEMAAGDRLQWQGKMCVAEGLTLREVRTAPRKERHSALLFFREPVSALRGKKITLAAAGDRTPRHMRWFAERVSPQGDGWLDRLYFLFVPKRRFVIDMDNSVPLPDGGTLVWWKLPNRNSTEWTTLFVDGGEGWRRIR